MKSGWSEVRDGGTEIAKLGQIATELKVVAVPLFPKNEDRFVLQGLASPRRSMGLLAQPFVGAQRESVVVGLPPFTKLSERK